MSAGGLSYSGLVNHGKITLPSVGSWGTNMNILRDPPKSITTRRIDRVGDTNYHTETIDDSGGRINEAIQVYARGVNPFVSVSYNNNGNNGGQQSGGMIERGIRSAKLPYPIMKDGAFRPPVLLQQDLLPLSRIPRGKTTAFSNSGFTDFSRKLRVGGTDKETKEVKNNTLKGHVRPTAVYKIEPQSQKPFEVKYVIQPFIKRSVTSGIRTMDITNQHVGDPTKEVNRVVRHSSAQSNLTDNRHVDNNEFHSARFIQDSNAHSVASNVSSSNNYNSENTELHTDRFMQDTLVHPVTTNIYDTNNYNSDNTEFHTDRFMQDTLVHPVTTNIYDTNNYNSDNTEFHTDRFMQNTLVHPVVSNISSNIHHTSIEDIFDLSDMPIHDKIIHCNINAPFSGVEQTKYFHNDIILSRTLPEYEARTNMSTQKTYKQQEYDNQIELTRNIPKTSYITNNMISPGFSDHSSRKVNLPEKINPGGFDIRAQMPMSGRMQDVNENKTESDKARMNRIVMENMNMRYTK